MANPSTKNGFLPIANELAEKFSTVNITGQEWRIIWVLLRKTWGYSKKDRRKDWDWISISQFETLTGMKRSNVFNTLKKLLSKRLILKDNNKYRFNQNHEEWLLAKRLTIVSQKHNTQVLAKSITPVSQLANTSVSQLTTYKIKTTKENKTKENIADTAKEEVANLFNSERRDIKIIWLYARAKNVNFPNKEVQSSFIKRNIKAANLLIGYDFNRIANTMKYLIDNADFKWTLETVGKYIDTDLLSIKNNDDEIIDSFFEKYKQ